MKKKVKKSVKKSVKKKSVKKSVKKKSVNEQREKRKWKKKEKTSEKNVLEKLVIFDAFRICCTGSQRLVVESPFCVSTFVPSLCRLKGDSTVRRATVLDGPRKRVSSFFFWRRHC